METLFILLGLLTLILFYFGAGKDKIFIFLFGVWQLLVARFAWLGVFEDHPPHLPGAIIIGILLILFGLRRRRGKKIETRILLAIHVLRIPVEYGLYQLYLQQKIPVIMTYRGWNFDIVMGITSLILLSYLLLSGRTLNGLFFKIWNVLGILFLLFIVTLAVLSAPLPIQQLAFEQPNIAVLQFPFFLLPTCIVPLVFVSHVLLLRQSGLRSKSH